MFKPEFIKILKSLNTITNTLVLRYPVTSGISEDQATGFFINISNFADKEFEPIYLNNNLSDFLSVFNLFGDDYNIAITDSIMHMSDKDGKIETAFILSNPDLMAKQYKFDPDKLMSFDKMNDIAVIDINCDTIKKIRNASAVFKNLQTLYVKHADDETSISLADMNKFSSTKTDSFKISFDVNAEKDFNIAIPINNFFTLPLIDYKLHVKYNSVNERYVLLFKACDIEDFAIVISVIV